MGISRYWTDLSLKWKLLILSCAGVLIIGICGVLLQEQESKQIQLEVAEAIKAKAKDETKRIAEGVYNMISTQDQLLKIKLTNDLAVAKKLIRDMGGITLSPSMMSWQVINQYTKAPQNINLPGINIGDTWLEKNTDSNKTTVIVDEVQKLVGGTCTIFQKMNSRGDMLRVATNIVKANGQRAIGTYIPATNPDGRPNPVISKVMSGQTYLGRAFVVDKWYTTAYEPIVDSQNQVIGIIYVGIPFEMVKDLRKSIAQVKVGKSGYAYVVGGTGNQLGKTIIHPLGVGEDLSQTKDSNGELVTQKIINAALKAKTGEYPVIDYPWQNKGEAQARMKFTATAYYEPWDWVIGVGTYEDEFLDSVKEIDQRFANANKRLVMITVGILLVVCLIAWFIAMGIAQPILRGVQMLDKVALEGDVSIRVTDDDLKRKDEIGMLAKGIDSLINGQKKQANMAELLAAGDWNQHVAVLSDKDQLGKALNAMVEQVNEALSGVKAASDEVDSGAGQISDASQSLSQGATESAASLEEISSSMTEIGSQTKANADNASQANILAGQTRNSAEAGNAKMNEMMNAMAEIQGASKDIAKIIKVIDDIAFQTNLLALNAAVEAARAGRHGKGFAVVADEVRNLAGRSAKAAKETSEMIEDSIGKVNAGTEIASATEKALQEIVDSSVKVADLVGEIAAASNEQAQGIAQIGQGLEQIDQVTQQNTANAEETAAAAEELSGQARELAALLARFQLRDAMSSRQLKIQPQASRSLSVERRMASNNEVKGAGKHNLIKPSEVITLDDDEFGRF